MLGPPSEYPLPPSPPYSGDDSPPPNISHLIPPNGLSTPERTPSASSSFGESPPQHDAGPSTTAFNHSTTRRQASTSDESSKGGKGYVAKLEDFELIRVIGKGCAGRVLMVKHTVTGSIRAMKAISKRSVFAHGELDHILTEQSILKRIATDEPKNRFISKLVHSFVDRENFYFVMDFYPGGDLATQMEIGILGDQRTRFYAADITQGLEVLHGIIVRDLKPENVLLNHKGHAVLADFGLSKEFSYRGDPQPMHIVPYPGQPEIPPWAGQGAGSLRTLPSGQKQLMVDKAYSFVGTAEYLSPEVVQRFDYSYAVDWWALGCIIVEGLVGRVPFKKADNDPPMVLWNHILYDPWDEMFAHPKLAMFMPDPVTYSFIDALLQKDPMWRLTEPCVKKHDYFAHVNWETVEQGGYLDPHQLEVHPVAEYNLKYWPKLCLEADITVDMSTHDIRQEDDYQRTPLNDNALYALEQAKFRKELERFTWNRADDGHETVEDSELSYEESFNEEEDEEEDGEEEGVSEGIAGLGSGLEGKIPIQQIEDNLSPNVVEAEMVNGKDHPRQSTESDYHPYKDEEDIAIYPPSKKEVHKVAASNGVSGQVLYSTAQHIVGVGSPESAYSTNLPPVASPLRGDPIMGNTSPENIAIKLLQNTEGRKTEQPTPVDTTTDTPVPASSKVDMPLSDQSGVAGLELVEKAPHSAKPTSLPQSPKSPPLSPHSTKSHPVPIPLRPKPVRQLSEEVNLPQGLPSSGLSVSDIVSIPSPHPGSSTRILRRHPQLPSVDNSIPIARLSVELHGVRTFIDDEDWEELSIPEGPNASAPNGDGSSSINHSFLGLGRVLKRRPSILMLGNSSIPNGHTTVGVGLGIGGSGLRRQIKTSDTSSSNLSTTRPGSSPSPTKQRPNLFSTKSIENTKKAFKFGKIKTKAFPRLRFPSGTGSNSGSTSNEWKSSLNQTPNPITNHSPLVDPPIKVDSPSDPNPNPNSRFMADGESIESPSKSITSSMISTENKDNNSSGSRQNRPSIGYRRHTESGLGWLRSKKKSSSGSASGFTGNPKLNPHHHPSNTLKSSSTTSSVNSDISEGKPKTTNVLPPSSPIKKTSDKDRSVSNSSSTVSISTDQQGLPKLDIELSGLGWEPFNDKEWGVK